MGEQVINKAIIEIENNTSIFFQLEKYIDEVEEIYFAGGKPLIMEEHYAILQLLIAKKRFYVRLIYNTNFSTFKYKNYDILKMWDQFTNITVTVSLDASYQRGEYLRKEQNLENLLQNRKTLLSNAPSIKFKIQSTISVFNVYHIVDFHREWIENNYIDPQNKELNILNNPANYTIQLLPYEFKVRVKEKIETHIEFIKKTELLHEKKYDLLITSYQGY